MIEKQTVTDRLNGRFKSIAQCTVYEQLDLHTFVKLSTTPSCLRIHEQFDLHTYFVKLSTIHLPICLFMNNLTCIRVKLSTTHSCVHVSPTVLLTPNIA